MPANVPKAKEICREIIKNKKKSNRVKHRVRIAQYFHASNASKIKHKSYTSGQYGAKKLNKGGIRERTKVKKREEPADGMLKECKQKTTHIYLQCRTNAEMNREEKDSLMKDIPI